jgi:hypothetical protein
MVRTRTRGAKVEARRDYHIIKSARAALGFTLLGFLVPKT